jgi:hypothetical protein
MPAIWPYGIAIRIASRPREACNPFGWPAVTLPAVTDGMHEREHTMRLRTAFFAASALVAVAISGASAQESYESWPPLKSTFESTGGGGFVIKGYDPVVRPNNTCVTTFMAVAPGADINVYYNVAEFEAVAAQGGTLCTNGKWRSMDGSASGTTPFRMFVKDGVFRRSP